MSSYTFKSEARQLVEQLPEYATWEDLIEQICVRLAIEAGLKDSDQRRTLIVAQVRKRFELPP